MFTGYWKILKPQQNQIPNQNQTRRLIEDLNLEQQLISKIIEIPVDPNDIQYSKTRINTKFKCPKCPKIFSNKCSVVQHMRYDCNRKPRFACPYCEFRSKWPFAIYKHIRKIHQGFKISCYDTT